MPRIRAGMKRPPPGFELINDRLDEYEAEMRVALSDDPSHAPIPTGKKGKKKCGNSSAAVVNESPSHFSESTEHTSEGVKGTVEKPLPPLWQVARINRERTRYVFQACYREKAISREVLDYCCEMNFIDAGLVRRWRLPGYESLCCTACGVPGTAGAAARLVSKHANRHAAERRGAGGVSGEGATCVCRVPPGQRRPLPGGCTVCGCTGCASGAKHSRGAMEEGGPTAKAMRREEKSET